MARVYVGLSGGVDSAVSAALLKEQNHEVTGVFIKIWQPEFIECTWREDRLDAMRVAAHLGIPFREVDLSDDYKREVIDTMIRDYKAGITPNPDVLCNEKIKFGSFFDWAIQEGADHIATGHYVRVVERGGTCSLHRGVDIEKDQSYFLYRIRENDLARSIFPVGSYAKKEIRARAVAFGLRVAAKRDSQGLCFVGDVSIPDFLSRFVRMERGDVLDTNGEVVGEHDGALAFTIGQRHGFRVRSAEKALYVVGIHAKRNAITIDDDLSTALQSSIRMCDAHWVNSEPKKNKEYVAQARYHGEKFLARVQKEGDTYAVVVDKPRLFSRGQSLVLYEGDRCVGGGIIDS
ncbi:tRNA 2-thiouridine(34) synthase MnmA [Candidatus Kaiserbacteria bacterium]|nr:tRNA 2-thiouridine(34) synthase MnmA [Candidatus Kaiserbacteria bacterium]